MIEEDSQVQMIHSQQLTDSPTNQNGESFQQKCQRMLAELYPDHFEQLKRSYQEDISVSRIVVIFSLLYLLEVLIFNLMDWEVSQQTSNLMLLAINLQFAVWKLINTPSFQESWDWFFWQLAAIYWIKFEGYSIIGFLCIVRMTVLVAEGICECIKDRLKKSNNKMLSNEESIQKMFQFGILTAIMVLRIIGYQYFLFENVVTSLLHFIIASQLCAFLCLTFEFNTWIIGYGRGSKLCLIYSHLCYYQFAMIFFMPFHQQNQPAAVAIASIALLQGLICWLLKSKFKPYILLLKQNKSTRGGGLKSRPNYCFTINQWSVVPCSHALKLKESSHFEDELCCLCNQRKAKIIFSQCGHVFLCLICTGKQIKKEWRVDRSISTIKCPLCRSNRNFVLMLGNQSSREIARQIVGQDDAPVRCWARYNLFDVKVINH